MKNKLNWLLAFAAFCVAVIGCKKDDPVVNGSTNWPGATVKASFVGQILDESGAPIDDAAVRVGNKTVTTDANGIFILRDQNVNSARAIVTAYKAGYFDAFRTFFVQNKSENRIVIRLLKRQNIGSFTASAGGKVSLAGGATIDFPAAAIVSGGKPFSGKVNVAAKWLDPTDPLLIEKTPGALRGLRTDGTEGGLQTFGMLGVELSDDTGQKLEIAAGKKANITMPIPASLAAKAPATIVLWHFSESEGIWVEEGSATKVGSNYEGEVAHFSWWNCDQPFDAILLKMCLKKPNGRPLINVVVELVSPTLGSRWGWTDSTGCVEGLVPANEILDRNIRIWNGWCSGQLIQTDQIGPFSTDTDLGMVTVDPSPSGGVTLLTTTISGRLTDCAGAGVSNGYVRLNDWIYAFPDANGNFSQAIEYCSDDVPTTAKAVAFDLEAGKQSAEVTTAWGATLNFGDIAACDDIDEYVRFKLDGGVQQTLTAASDSAFFGNSIYLSGWDPAKGVSVNLSWNHTSQPANDLPLTSVSIWDQSLGQSIYGSPSVLPFNVTTDMTSYPTAVGDYLIGTFDGSFKQEGTTVTRTISGSYRVKRKW